MIPQTTQAIQNALLGNWAKAIELNLEILKENPEEIETLNRLALAQTIIGKVKEAKKTYQKVLKLDNQNLIASRNIKLISEIKQTPYKSKAEQANYKIGDISEMFLEETGKTKIIELVNIAEHKTISILRIGEIVDLLVKRLKIHVIDSNHRYVGMIPDDLGKRLIKLLNGGNAYQTYIKSINSHRVVIFIKEIKRSPRFKNQPSFIATSKLKVTVSNYRAEKDEEEEKNEREE